MRTWIAVIVSYAAMGAFALLSLFALAALFDVEDTAGPAPPSWLVAIFLLDLLQTFLGGALCARIGRCRRAVASLAWVVFLMGFGSGGVVLYFTADDGFFQPSWFVLGEPAIDAGAVWLGGFLALRGRAVTGAPQAAPS